MTNIRPLQVKNFLAAHNIKKTPVFSVQVSIDLISNSKSSDAMINLNCSDPKALRALIALMDMGAVIGGAASHYGGPAALAEAWSALHAYVFYQAEKANQKWHDLFHLINDAGHCENGLYALKANYEMAGLDFNSLKKFRSIESPLTGHGEAHLFPEGVYMSNGPLGSSFPQSQGLALAEKLAGTNRTTICTLSDGAAMEGEAKEAMAAIPGLARAGQLAPYVLLISDNNTKLSGRIDQDSFSMRPTFQSLETLGWKLIQLEQGNDLQKCLEAISNAIRWAQDNPLQPVALWMKTIKGIGTKKTAESASGGHGFPCKSASELKSFISEIYDHQSYPQVFDQWIEELVKVEADIKSKSLPDHGEKIQKGVAKALIQSFKKGLPVISVTSDLPGSTGLADFRKEFPQASFDVGVAESNMISTAAGLSKQGYIPVVDTFAQFGVTKGALPLTMAMLSDCPMIAVFSHTGFQDAADGASHQALSYMSMLATIPGVDLYSLSSSEEAEILMTEVIDDFAKNRQLGQPVNSSIFFLGRENFPKSFSTEKNKLSYKAKDIQVVQSHLMGAKNVLIITTGSLLGQALQASDQLKDQGTGSIVLNLNCLNSLNMNQLKPLLNKCEGRIITLEDHQTKLGLGSFVSHQCALHSQYIKMHSLGVHEQFGQSAYNAIELYKKHKMDANSIVEAAQKLLG